MRWMSGVRRARIESERVQAYIKRRGGVLTIDVRDYLKG